MSQSNERSAFDQPDGNPPVEGCTAHSLPRIIYAIWFQGLENAPPMVRANLSRWRDLNPEYELRVLDLAQVKSLLADKGLNFEKFRPAALSNIARLELLSRTGGVWVDATLYPRVPLSAWINDHFGPEGFFAFRNPGVDRKLAVWFLAVSENNPMLLKWKRELLRFWGEERIYRPIYKIPDDPVATVRPGAGNPDNGYPYFIFAYLFAYLLEEDADFGERWKRCSELSADPPHALMRRLSANARIGDEELKRILDAAPVHKLNWRGSFHPSFLRRVYNEDLWSDGSVNSILNRFGDEVRWLGAEFARAAKRRLTS